MAAKKTVIVFGTPSGFGSVIESRVLTRVAVPQERVNSSESWTTAIRDSEPVGSGSFESLARLIDCRQSDKLLVTITGCIPLTVVSNSQLRL